MNYFDLYYQIVSQEQWFNAECAKTIRAGSSHNTYISIIKLYFMHEYTFFISACRFWNILNEYNNSF